jgi:hypothetical protein
MTAAVAALPPPAAAPAPHPSAWHNGNSFGFRDLIDIINPLQHIPVIGSIYRWATGDRPGEAAQIAGDALYGGPIGVGVGLVSAALEDSQGRDLGERVLVAAFGPGHDGGTAAAQAAPQPTAQAAGAAPAAIAATAPVAPKQLYGGIAQPPPSRAAAAASAPGVPDHAPIPLYGGIAQPTPSPAQVDNPGARALLERATPLERAAPASARSGATMTAPVPLNVPPGALPAGMVPAGRLPTLQPAQPLDISQKMMDGLDKYMKLQDDRKRPGAAPNPASGPAPGAPPTPGVDLSL